MKKRTATILMTVAGVAIFAGILLIGSLIWFFTSAFETTRSDRGAAAVSFESVRARFGETTPILAMEGDRVQVTRRPPDHPPGADLRNVQLLAWDPNDQGLTHVTLPFWLLRLKSGPVNISAQSVVRDVRVSMTVEELERYGPALLLDYTEEDGQRVLVWTE